MNGNRGAKGSINDRLISMMYRNRYKKWKLQHDSYRANPFKIYNEKTIDYLKTIRTFDYESNQDVSNLNLVDSLVVEDAFTPIKQVTEDIPLMVDKKNEISNVVEQSTNLEQKEQFSNNDAKNMHDLSEKIIEFDPKTEDYDFKHYDYYEVILNNTKVGTIEESEIIEPEKELNIHDNEIVVVDELTEFIDDSKEQLIEIKKEITEIKELINIAETQDEIEAIEFRMNRLQKEIAILKAKYEKIKDHYDLSEFIILDSITYMDAIGELKDEASIEQLEIMVDICKNEIEELDDIVEENKRGVEAKEEFTSKQQEIENRDKAFIKHTDRVMEVDKDYQQIINDTKSQMELLKHIREHLYDFEIEVIKTTKIVNRTQSLFGSFLRIATGILTRPFTGINLFGIALGTNLINRGLRGLREYLNPEIEVIEENRKKYCDMEEEILKGKNLVNNTKMLLSDSLWQLTQLEQEFQTTFANYTNVIPEYKQVLDQMHTLKNGLIEKERQLELQNHDLDRQYEANKIKLKKAS